MTAARPAPVYDSAARGNHALEEFREALNYRSLIVQFMRRDIIARYRRSFLGVAWTMLNPLGMMVVMTVVFSTVFGRDPGYPAYLLSGLLAWQFFSQATSSIMSSMEWGGTLLQRIYLPRTVFAISSTGSGLVNLVLSIVPLLIVMLFVRVPVRWTIIYLPLSMLSLAMFAMGLGLLLSTLSMFFPDISQMYNVVLRAWLYLTPIIYPESILPERVMQAIRLLNPMFYQIKLFRIPIYEGRIPTLEETLIPFALSTVTLIAGWFIFSQRSDEFAYRI